MDNSKNVSDYNDETKERYDENHSNFNTKIKSWYKDDVLHRLDGPARIHYNNMDRISVEEWYMNGKYHRIGGPAVVTYFHSKSINLIINEELWYKNGLRHREDGPAVISFHKNGKVKQSRWFIYNQMMGWELSIWASNMGISLRDYKNWSDEIKTMFKITFC